MISGALGFIHDEFNMSTVQQELVVGATTFGAIWSGFGAGLVSTYHLYAYINNIQCLRRITN